MAFKKHSDTLHKAVPLSQEEVVLAIHSANHKRATGAVIGKATSNTRTKSTSKQPMTGELAAASAVSCQPLAGDRTGPVSKKHDVVLPLSEEEFDKRIDACITNEDYEGAADYHQQKVHAMKGSGSLSV